jgi:hypothetical protein
MRSRRVFFAVAVIGLGVLTGCVSYQVDDHSFQFNEATGSLSLRMLLLNAVRASKDYPLQFSKIQSYQGTGTTSASVSATLPLKALPPLPGSGTATPRVDWKDGISQLTLVDLNTEEAQQALKKTLPLRAYKYYDAYGGNRSYVTPIMLMVEHVSMPRKLYKLIGSYVDHRCAQYLSGGVSQKTPRYDHNLFACAALRRLQSQCNFERTLLAHPDETIAFLQNHVSSECQHLAFVGATLYLAVIGGTVGPVQKTDKGGGRGGPRPPPGKKAPGNNTINIYTSDKAGEDKADPEKDKEDVILPFYDEAFAAACLAQKLCRRRPEVGVLAMNVEIQLRSPERMVRFLGELISAQSYGPQRFQPIAVDPIRLQEYKLLTVKLGTPPPGGAAVSVAGPDGETVYVPRHNDDARKTDLSLEVLAIVSDVLNGAVSKKAFPPVTTLTVTTP